MVMGVRVVEVRDRYCHSWSVLRQRQSRRWTNLESSLSFDGDKDDSLFSVRFGVIDGKVRAAHDSDDDLAIE